MIVNPIDNQIYSIHSVNGRELLKIYIDNYKNGGMKRKRNSTKSKYIYLEDNENKYKSSILELSEKLIDYIHNDVSSVKSVLEEMKNLSKKITASTRFTAGRYFKQWISKPLKEISYYNTSITLLMYSSVKGNYNVVKELIEAGVDLNKKTKKGETALIKAIKRGHLNIVQLICDEIVQKHLDSIIFANYNPNNTINSIKSAIYVAEKYDNNEITDFLKNVLEEVEFSTEESSEEPVLPEKHDIFNPTKPTTEDDKYFSEEMATPEELKGLIGPGGTALKYYEAADIPEFNPGKPMRIDDKRKPMTLGEIKTSDKRPTGKLLDQEIRNFYEDANPVEYLPREYRTMVGFHAKGDGLKKTNDIIKPPQILLKRIEDMKVAELKRELKGYKKSTAGKKAELIKRLRAARNNNVEEPEPIDDTPFHLPTDFRVPLPPLPPRRPRFEPGGRFYSTEPINNRPTRNLSFPQKKGNPGGRRFYSDWDPINDYIKDHDITPQDWEENLVQHTQLNPTPLKMTFKHGTEK